MSDRLQGKRIIIVGGTSGLGWAAARACAAEGARVVAVGRRAAEQVGDWLEMLGDATDPVTAERAIELAVQEWGGLDGLYHVAGGSGRSRGDGPLAEISDDGWTYTLRQNLDSVFYSNRAAVRQFLRQAGGGDLSTEVGEEDAERRGGGVVLNMTSVLAFSPSPRHFATHAYAAAKAAIVGLTTTSAAYYARHNIRFNAIAPAVVETPMATRALRDPQILDFIRRKQPLDGGRAGVPDDVSDAVVYLLSDESRFVTGQVLAIDGGWSVTDL